MKTLAILALLAVAATSVQDAPAPPAQTEQHGWLQQLVGEWTVTSEATMEPGADPMKHEGTESVRSIGGLWIVAEGKASMPMTWLLTLVYDPLKKSFVGTWIDTMQTHLWSYLGTLDDAKKVLTLVTEGPFFGDPSKMATYRDVIEVKGVDHRTLTSSVKNEDGSWSTFLRADYRRKK